jgi:hypothetical protein
MRILLDESVPWRLGSLLAGHTTMAVQRHGCASVKNGKLLALAANEFDVLLTAGRQRHGIPAEPGSAADLSPDRPRPKQPPGRPGTGRSGHPRRAGRTPAAHFAQGDGLTGPRIEPLE